MIITRLFDMSDVEHANVSDESDIIPINCCDQNDLLIKAMTNIMDSYVDNALNIVFGQEGHGDDYRLKSHYFDSSDHTEGSSYSFLSDSADVCKDMCSNTNNEAVGKKSDNEELAEVFIYHRHLFKYCSVERIRYNLNYYVKILDRK